MDPLELMFREVASAPVPTQLSVPANAVSSRDYLCAARTSVLATLILTLLPSGVTMPVVQPPPGISATIVPSGKEQ